MVAAVFGEKFAWMAMQGKHWIVQAHSKEAAMSRAELMELDELGIPEATEKYQHVVKKVKSFEA